MNIEECIAELEEDAKNHYEMVSAYHSDEGVYLREETYHREKAERSERIVKWLKELVEWRNGIRVTFATAETETLYFGRCDNEE